MQKLCSDAGHADGVRLGDLGPRNVLSRMEAAENLMRPSRLTHSWLPATTDVELWALACMDAHELSPFSPGFAKAAIIKNHSGGRGVMN